MRVLAIDPGPSESAAVLYNTDGLWPPPRRIMDHLIPYKSKRDNRELAEELDGFATFANLIVIEEIVSYGMAVSKSVFETCRWEGRFAERFYMAGLGDLVQPMRRLDVKLHLCHSARASDANVRRALLDLERWPRADSGSERVIGLKDDPGPLYGMSGDLWSALALAVTGADEARGVESE